MTEHEGKFEETQSKGIDERVREHEARGSKKAHRDLKAMAVRWSVPTDARAAARAKSTTDFLAMDSFNYNSNNTVLMAINRLWEQHGFGHIRKNLPS